MPQAPFGSSELPFGELGFSILALRETILAPRGRPRGPSQNPGTALEDHGSGRMDARWSGKGFASILECFWDPCILALYVQEA